MRRILAAVAVMFSLACLTPAPAALAIEGDGEGDGGGMGRGMGAHRFGLGVNYWKTLDNIDQDVHTDGFSYLATYQYAPVWFFKIEADLELYPDLAASTDPVLAPELFLTVGGPIYGGVGMGIYYHDGDWGSAPFFMLRAGFDFPVLPRLFLDVNLNYRFNDWDTLEWSDLDTDTLRLGAALRFTI